MQKVAHHMEKDKSKKSGILPKNVMVKYMTHIQVKNLNGIELKRKLEEIRVKNTAQPEADGTLVILEGWAEESDSAKVDALLAEYPNLIFSVSGQAIPDGWY